MNEYLFTSIEGETVSPNFSEVENCQLLARINAPNKNAARNKLLEENKWITVTDFSTEELIVDQIITKEQISDIKRIVDFLWESAKSSCEEMNYPQDHIFMVLKRIKEMVVDYK